MPNLPGEETTFGPRSGRSIPCFPWFRPLDAHLTPSSIPSSPSQREIKALIEKLGATFGDQDFTAASPFDYCVTKNTNSPKYDLAVKLFKPVVTSAWLRDSAEAGELLPVEEVGHVPKAFLGLCVCVTGYTQDERAELEAMVTKNGGLYMSDLVKGKCTHLVASGTTSGKYTHAKKWEFIKIVSREWVRESAGERVKANEVRFPVEGTPEAAAAAARANNDADEAADAAVAWDSCYLMGCTVYLHELGNPKESTEWARATQAVRHGSAMTTSNASKATHVVVSVNSVAGSLRDLRVDRDKVVFSTWLDACKVQGAPAPIGDHATPAALFAARREPNKTSKLNRVDGLVLSQEAASTHDKGKGKPIASKASETADRRRRKQNGPASPNPLTRQALAAEAAKAAAEEAAAASKAAPADQNMPPHLHQPLSPAADPGCSFDPGTGTELPATAVAILETNEFGAGAGDGEDYSTVFRGMRIALSPLLSKEEEEAASDLVSRGSGTPTKKKTASSAYIVCPAAPTREERAILNSAPESERKRHVTCHWLEISCELGYVVPLDSNRGGNPACRPLPCDAPFDSMHGLRISTSLYDEDVKSSVNMLCHLLGAKYTERLGRNKNTHLVVPYAEGKKYEAAVGWGLHAVTVEWLHACIEAGRKVDERAFHPPPPPSEDDDGNGDDGKAGAFTADGGNTQEAAPPATAGSDRRRSAGIDIGGGGVCGGSQRGALNLVGSEVQRAAKGSTQPPPPSRKSTRPMSKTPAQPKAGVRSKQRRGESVAAPTAAAPAPATGVKRPLGSDRSPVALGVDLEHEPPASAPQRPTAGGRAAQPAADGSQMVANLIDTVAAGMFDGGETQFDDGFDGFRVPDPVQTEAAVAAVRDGMASPGGAGRGKRRRVPEDTTPGGMAGGIGGVIGSQMMESQQMVGYADDAPPRGRSHTPGEAVGGGRGGARVLVNSLLGAAGRGAGGSNPSAAAAGLQAEDWV